MLEELELVAIWSLRGYRIGLDQVVVVGGAVTTRVAVAGM